jgi:hypothetical protein
MISDNKAPKSPENAELVQVSDDFLEIACGILFLGNEDGFNRDEKVILTIIDNQGREVPGRWGKEWIEVAPGIQTRKRDGSTRSGNLEQAHGQEMIIYRSACPVYVQFRYLYRYSSYDGEDSSSSRGEWIRYEAAVGSKQNS